MKIACIGGGPAGLYLGILVKRVAPEHEVVVYERNRPSDTFGFGVVFSDATLGNLAAADPETHAQITARFARWDDIETHVGGAVLRSTGHGFCGIERKQLLQILQARAGELGVRVEYEHEVKTLAELAGADVVALRWRALVASRGVWVANRRAPRKVRWLGSTVRTSVHVPVKETAPAFRCTSTDITRWLDVHSRVQPETGAAAWRAGDKTPPSRLEGSSTTSSPP